MSSESSWGARNISGVTLQPVRAGWLTYEHFYGLKEKPFSLSSDPTFFYNSASHAAAFDDLLSGIRRRESLSVLSGDIGTGKTTLCRTVVQNLDRQTFSAFVPDPFATREDLLKVVLVDFGVVSRDDLAAGRLRGASRTELSYLLYEFLGTLSPLQAFAIIVIDEAQNLSLPLLEEIRILSDSDGRERQLQVVLVGQPELRDKLRLPEMRQVAQRVTVRCGLEPLDRDGVDGYIAHRLTVAGGTPDRVRFSREARDAVYDASRGVPRVINRICDRALHHGHQRRVAVIDRPTVALATGEMELVRVMLASASALAAFPSESAVVAPESHEPASPAAVAPALAAFPSETPTTEAPASSQPVALTPLCASVEPSTEEWFEQIDASVTNTVEAVADADPVAGMQAVPITPLPPRSRTSVPLTHMEMLQRTWLRRLKILFVLLVIVAGAGFGLAVAVNVMTQPVVSPDVSSPAPPPMPAQIVAAPVPFDELQPPPAPQNVPPSY